MPNQGRNIPEDDVEGHGGLGRRAAEGYRATPDEDDTEGHGGLGRRAAEGFVRQTGDEDDVEGHQLRNL